MISQNHMKNINRLTTSALLLALVFAGSNPALASSESQSHKLALLGSTEVLGNLELNNNTKLEMGNGNLLKAGVKADARADLKASMSARHDDDRDGSQSNVNASSNGNASSNVGVRAEDHWDNRSSGKDDDRGNGNDRSWFGWLGNLFRKDHGTTSASSTTSVNASTTATTTADTARPMIYKKVRFVTASASTTASSTTTVTWNTNENTYGEVRVATSTASGTPSVVFLDGNLSTSHTVTLTGLDLDTKYFVTITAKDASENVMTSGALKFTPKEGKSENVTISANAFVRLWHSIFW